MWVQDLARSLPLSEKVRDSSFVDCLITVGGSGTRIYCLESNVTFVVLCGTYFATCFVTLQCGRSSGWTLAVCSGVPE